jgi:hypothetical protein
MKISPPIPPRHNAPKGAVCQGSIYVFGYPVLITLGIKIGRPGVEASRLAQRLVQNALKCEISANSLPVSNKKKSTAQQEL